MKKYLKELIIILIVLAPATYLAMKWSVLPNEIIVHANNGEIEYKQHKLSLVWLLVLNFGFYLLMLLAPRIKNKEQEVSNRYHNIRLISTFFISSIISYFIVTTTFAYPRSISVVFFFVGIFQIILGNYWPTIRSNRWFGYSTPETVESPNVWRKTHRASGRLMMVLGFVLMILSLKLNIFLLIVFMSIMSLTLTIFAHNYSYYAFKKELKFTEREKSSGEKTSMNKFESKIVKTNNWDKTPTKIASMILFIASTIIIFPPLDLTQYFSFKLNDHELIKGFVIFFYTLGWISIFVRMGRFVHVGKIDINKDLIEINTPQLKLEISTNDLSLIYLKYVGYSKNWNSWGLGGKNVLEITDNQNDKHSIQFTLDSKKDKRNLIAILRTINVKGVKVEYNTSTFYNDDFTGLRERY